MTQADLGRAMGVTQSVVSDWERGQLESWLDVEDKLSAKLGKAKGFFSGTPRPEPDLPEAADANADLPALVPVPIYDVRLSAGPGFIVDRETIRRYWPLPRWLVVDNLALNPDTATMQEVIGDSMAPTLEDGDYVLIDLSDKRIGLPGIFAVWDSDALVCKRIEIDQDRETPSIRLMSDNARYREYVRAVDQVQIIGRVRWVTRRL